MGQWLLSPDDMVTENPVAQDTSLIMEGDLIGIADKTSDVDKELERSKETLHYLISRMSPDDSN